MKIIDNIAHKLYLGVSKIPGAGVGLFTGVNISSGKPICEYKGQVFDLDSISEEDWGNFNGTVSSLQNPKKIGPATKKAQEQLGEKYAYTMQLGFEKPVPMYSISWMRKGVNKMIDAQPSLTDEELGLGGFANDKRGYLERTGAEYEKELNMRTKWPKTEDEEDQLSKLDISLGYNVVYWSHPTEVLVYLLSTKNIKAGEELYVNYGHTYWTPFIKKIEKDKAAEEEAKKAQEQPEKTESNSPPKATIVDAPSLNVAHLAQAAPKNIKDE